MKATTTTKENKEKIRQHILECVLNYDEEQFPTFREACEHLNSEFERVQGHLFACNKSRQELFADYLCGIPFDFAVWDEDVRKLVISFGGKDSDYDERKTWELYCYLIFREMNAGLNLKKFNS